MIDIYRKRQPSEMTLDEILGAGIAEATQRAQRAEAENARLRTEIAELREPESDPPESTQAEIKSPGGWRIRAPWWLALILAVMITAATTAKVWLTR